MSLADTMLKELSAHPDRAAHIDSNQNILIRCPNPEHKGGMQSGTGLRIQTQGQFAGNFKCYACGFKGKWNDLARMLKMKSLDGIATDDGSEVFSAEELAALGLSQANVTNPRAEVESPWWPDTDWRGIKGKYVAKVGGLLVLDERANSKLRLPVTYHGDRCGYVDCILEKKFAKQLSYINSPGKWSEYYLLFFDYCYKRIRVRRKKGLKTVLFLVEGPRDALNVIQCGGLCVPVLGAANISKRKTGYLEELNPDLYVMMFDGDDAGDHAFEVAGEYLSHLPTDSIKLPRGKDPMEIPRSLMRSMIRHYQD